MSWTYIISSGWMISPAGRTVSAYCYSGAPGAVNDPTKTNIPDVGPIPVGNWSIGAPYDDEVTGLFTLPLTPVNGTNTFGRTEFKIHGDSVVLAGLQKASKGCIVCPRFARETIAASPDKMLSVIAERPLSEIT